MNATQVRLQLQELKTAVERFRLENTQLKMKVAELEYSREYYRTQNLAIHTKRVWESQHGDKVTVAAKVLADLTPADWQELRDYLKERAEQD